MTRKEVQEIVIDFYKYYVEKVGPNKTAALRMSKTDPIITSSEMYEAAIEDKDIEGYGNPIDKYIEIKKVNITE